MDLCQSCEKKNVKYKLKCVEFCLEKDECIKCGKRDFPAVIFKGTKVL